MTDDLTATVERLKKDAEYFERIYLRHGSGGQEGSEADDYGRIAADLARDEKSSQLAQMRAWLVEALRRFRLYEWDSEDPAPPDHRAFMAEGDALTGKEPTT